MFFTAVKRGIKEKEITNVVNKYNYKASTDCNDTDMKIAMKVLKASQSR